MVDLLFSGSRPLVDVLQQFAAQQEALDAVFGSLHDPVKGVRWWSRSWHGLLARWAAAVVAYAPLWRGRLRRELFFSDAVPFVEVATKRNLGLREDLAQFVADIRKAVDGLLPDECQGILVGLEAERDAVPLPGAKKPNRTQQKAKTTRERVAAMLSDPKWKDAKQGAQAKHLGIEPRTLRDHLKALRD